MVGLNNKIEYNVFLDGKLSYEKVEPKELPVVLNFIEECHTYKEITIKKVKK